MAHPDMQLISRIIRQGALEGVLEWGITTEDITLLEAKSMLNHLLGLHLSPDTRGSIVGTHAAAAYYPSFVYCDDDSMTTAALCQQVRERRIDREMEQALIEADKIRRHDPRAAVRYMGEVTQRLDMLATKTSDMDFLAGMEALRREYLLQESGVLTGAAHWPASWAPLEQVTKGIQRDDYIIVFGRPKSMKSFILSVLAASMYDQGLKVLLYTKEMPAVQLYRRTVGCCLRLPYNDLRLASLNPVQRAAFMGFYDELAEERTRTGGAHDLIVISAKDAPGGDTIQWVSSKIKKYKPDIVFIDGLYLLSANIRAKSDEERVRSVSRDARSMVLDHGIPLIATMQATRAAAKHKGANLDEIAYSDAVSQDATIAMRAVNDDTQPRLSLVLGGSREFKLKGLLLNAVPCENFECIGALSEGEALEAKERDNARANEEENRRVVPLRKAKSPVTKDDIIARAAEIEARAKARMGTNDVDFGRHTDGS